MSRKDYITGRMDGLKLALRIADRDGIDGIRKEIAYRNNGGINTRLSMRELDEASQTIKENCVDTIRCMEYDFCQSALPCKRRELYLQKQKKNKNNKNEVNKRF